MGKLTAELAIGLGQRPCDLVGFKGSMAERLLFDITILSETRKKESEGEQGSTYAKIMQRRRASGVYT